MGLVVWDARSNSRGSRGAARATLSDVWTRVVPRRALHPAVSGASDVATKHSTLVRSLYPGANFASVVRPIPAGPGQTLSGGCIRDRNTRNKFFATRFAHFFIIKVPGVRPGFPTLHYGLTPTAPRGRIWRKSHKNVPEPPQWHIYHPQWCGRRMGCVRNEFGLFLQIRPRGAMGVRP